LPAKRPVADKDWIYYQSNISGNEQIYKVDYSGTQILPVTNYLGSDAGFPSLNKEVTKLLFALKRDNEYAIIEHHLQGDSAERVFSIEKEVLYPTYTSNGSQIVYILITRGKYKDQQKAIDVW